MPTQLARLILEVLEENGLSRAAVLAGTGIRPVLLEQEETCLTYRQYLSLVKHALAPSDICVAHCLAGIDQAAGPELIFATRFLRLCFNQRERRSRSHHWIEHDMIVLISRTLLVVAMLGFLSIPVTAADKPNILLILTDNTGWGDWGAYGGGALRGAPSPNIDQLAREGLLLQNFNTEPQCSPSRAALLTGRHAIRSGNQSVPIGTELYGLVPWEITLAEILSAQGYATGAFGKWHLGKTPGRFPTDQGFDEWYGIPNSTDESQWLDREALTRHSIVNDVALTASQVPWIMESRNGGAPQRLKRYDQNERRLIDAELTRRTIDFMQRKAGDGKPFFAFVPLTATHYPTLPHPDFAGRSGHGDYADMLVQTDAYVGRMLAALDRLGIAENTLVIFTADNGPEHPDVGDGQYTGWTGPWAGTYFTAMEGGLRVPFLARWPAGIPAASVSNQIVHIVDLLPTLATLAGATVPTDRAIDGVDMSAFFTGEQQASGREGFLVYVGDDLRAIKWRNWKLHYAWQETKRSPVERFSTVPKLVDLIRDPRETRNVGEPYNGWIQFPMIELALEFQKSMQRYPNVPVGAPDGYEP